MMKRTVFLAIGCLWLTTGYSRQTEQKPPADYGDRQLISGFDPEERKAIVALDFDNTVCDTLFFEDRVILLDRSPLAGYEKQAGLRSEFPAKSASPAGETCQPVSSLQEVVNTWPRLEKAYRCKRGYTAAWTIEDGRLYLLHVTPCDETGKPLSGPKKKAKKKAAAWVDGVWRGGAGCVATHLGYASKEEYVFTLDKGKVVSVSQASLPTGTYENSEALTAFMRENYPNRGSRETVKRIREQFPAVGKDQYADCTYRLTTNPDGTCMLYLSPEMAASGLGKLNTNRSEHTRQLFHELYLAHCFPAGSFYGRFLRGGLVLTGVKLTVGVNCDAEVKADFGTWDGWEEMPVLR